MSDISRALKGLVTQELAPKEFSTGSKGFRAVGKITADGVRFQAQTQAVLIVPKTFSSGNTGFYVGGTVTAGGQRFQAQAQAVRLS
jgi:hypothetical protein